MSHGIKFEEMTPRDRREIALLANMVYEIAKLSTNPQNAANAIAWVIARIVHETQVAPGEAKAREAVSQIGAIAMLYWAQVAGVPLRS